MLRIGLIAIPKSTNWFTRWLRNEDKVCTDRKDDGKISAGDFFKSFGKGLIGFVKNAINHPIMTGVTIVGAIGLNLLTGGAAMIPMLALGATLSAGTIGYGTYKVCTAKTDGEAKTNAERIGNGVFGLVTSMFFSKNALNSGANAGVTSAQGAKYKSSFEAFVQLFKSTPEAIKQCGINVKHNFSAITGPFSAAFHKNGTTPVPPKDVDPISNKFGFEIKKNQAENFLRDLRMKPDDLGYADVQKILAGLDKMSKTGKMNLANYEKLANSVHPDLPGGYWRHAVNLFNMYGKNAYPLKVNGVVNQYMNLEDLSINGLSSAYHAIDPIKNLRPLEPAIVTSTVIQPEPSVQQ